MKNAVESLLSEMGFSSEQAKIYLAALELGQASMQELATKSGIPRTTIYHMIKGMVVKHLISTSKRKRRTVYSAVHPNQLLALERTRLRELEALMPELLVIHNEARNKPRVTFHEGAAGIKEVFTDVLKERKPFYEWNDHEHLAQTVDNYFFKVFPEERARKGIPAYTLCPDGPVTRNLIKLNNRHLREIKLLPFREFKTAVATYANKVLIVSFHTDPPYGLLIEDQNIADTVKSIWQQQWDSLRVDQNLEPTGNA